MPDFIPTGWTLAAALDHWLLYGAMLLATGSALFILWMPTPFAVKVAAAQVGRHAAVVAIVTYVLVIGLGGADLLGAPAGLFDVRAWSLGSHTTLWSSAMLGVAGMALLLIGVLRPGGPPSSVARLSGFAGLGLAIASFLVTGHPASTPPRWLLVPTFGLHLLAAAFWLGALWPLRVAAGVLPAAEAGRLMALFSRRATAAVAAVVASGVVVSWIQLRTVAALDSSYGQRLMVKLALVAALLALACHNKTVLTPALIRGENAAAGRLRRAIAWELALFVLILGAAIALTQVAPPRDLTPA